MLALGVIGVAGLAALAYGTWWLDRRFGSHKRLPHHFDFRGRPDSFGQSWVILRLLPAILGGALILLFALNIGLYDPTQHIAMLVGLAVAVISTAGTLALTGWLLIRWEKNGAGLDR